MSVEWTLTHADATSCIVWVRSDAEETITISTSSGAFSTTVNPAVEDGTSSITVTGLTGDTTGTINGEPILLKVSPAMPVIAVPSCANGVADAWAHYLMGQGVNVTVFAGDMPYPDDTTLTFAGITTKRTAYLLADNTAAQYAAHYKQFRRVPGVRSLLRQSLLYATYDDHEVVNNWDWTLARANTYTTLATDAAELRAVYDRAMQAWEWYHARGLQKPGGLDTDPGTQYSTCRHGPVFIAILDCISHKSPAAQTDDASKYMLGPLQEARLIADITGSDAPFKIIVSGKQPYTNASANQDGWSPMDTNTGYTTQRERIAAALAGTPGVVWACGDDHSATVVDHPSGVLMVSGCPCATSNQSTGQGADYETGVVFKGFGNPGAPPANLAQYATNILRVLPTGELSIELHDLTHRTLWWRRIMRPDGTTYYPGNRVG